MTPVYILTKRGVLHRAVRSEQGLLTKEPCNLDQVTGRTEHAAFPPPAKRRCKRCFPMTDEEQVEPLTEEDEASGLESGEPPAELEPLPEDNLEGEEEPGEDDEEDE